MTLVPPAAAGAVPSPVAGAIGQRRAAVARGNALAALSMVIWAAGFPAAEALLSAWPPILLVPARFLVALLALGPLWLLIEGRPRGLPWGRGLGVGAVGIGGGAVTLLYAQAVSDPVTVAVFASVSPLTGTLVEIAYGERRPSRGFLLGLVASIAGGALATAGSGLGGGALAGGAALAGVSCVLYSWGSHETVRLMPAQSPLGQTAVTMAGAVLSTGLLGAAAWAGGVDLPPLHATDAGLLAIYGVGGMAISQLMFIAAVGRIGVALSSFHMNVAPFYVMLFMLALGGGWSWLQAAGAGVVALGVVVAQRA